MSKSIWKHAPDWAEWLAMDESQYWYWFEEKPIMQTHFWTNRGNSRWLLAAEPSKQSITFKWDETLEKRPE
jgi:hypothetical protein